MLELITDRTQADVDRLKDLISRGWNNLTADEKAEYWYGYELPMVDELGEQFEDSTGELLTLREGVQRGAYNYTDLNRVESAVAYIVTQLLAIKTALYNHATSLGVSWDSAYNLPYNPSNYTLTTKTDWTKEDIPTVADMTRYLGNVQTLITAITAEYPTLPTSMSNLDYEKANNIESALLILYYALIDKQERITAMIDGAAASFVYSGQPYSGMIWTQFS